MQSADAVAFWINNVHPASMTGACKLRFILLDSSNCGADCDDSVGALRARAASARLVGVTCLGATHALLSRERFERFVP